MSVQPRPSKPVLSLLALSVPLLFAACSPKAGTPVIKPPPDGPFTVSDYFAPSGAMGDGETPGNLTTTVADMTKCKARPDGARGYCYVFDYVAGPMLFAGVYWQDPANNWGTAPGLPIHPEKLMDVSFQAAVAAIPDGMPAESMTFEIGGIGLPPDPTADATRQSMGDTNNDQFINKDVFMVTTDWQKFTLKMPPPLDPATPITNLLGAFAWFANYPPLAANVDPTTFDYSTLTPKTIYIDDVVYE